MTAAAASLGLYFENQRVGWVYDTQALSFEYDSAWLAERTLCVGAIPLLPGRTDAPSVVAFFENLLPEGELRTCLFAAKQTSTLFGLLQAVAGDTATQLPSHFLASRGSRTSEQNGGCHSPQR